MNSPPWILATGFWDDAGIWIDSAPLVPPPPRVASLLPTNATAHERAMEQVTAYGSVLPEVVRPIWNADTCPEELLPWLAWAMSVDDWDSSWSDTTKRAVIRASSEVHRQKGTRAAVEAALRAAGYGDAVIVEDFTDSTHDGTLAHDGTSTHARGDHWAEYRVTLARPITIEQSAQVRRILGQVAPMRSHLKQLDFQQVAHLHNATIVHDGQFTHGTA